MDHAAKILDQDSYQRRGERRLVIKVCVGYILQFFNVHAKGET